jgi:hypothetical protein
MGSVHNDDPEAASMWMGNGSFWTQPKGEVHVTAAKGANNIALVEIDQGPYLVRPPDQAFDSGERPVNLDAGFEGVLTSEGDAFHGVVIRGTVKYRGDGVKELTPGSYVGARGATEHRIAADTDNESIIYVRTNGAYRVRSTK